MSASVWEDAAGLHISFPVPEEPPPGATDQMTAEFQKRLRNSPMWKEMVDEFGEGEAERLLKGCEVGIK